MEKLIHVDSFRDLLVYGKARELAGQIFRIGLWLYVSSKKATIELCQEIGKMLASIIMKADKFCGEPAQIRETPPEYFTHD